MLFASIAKRFYRKLSQRIITNDDVIRQQPISKDSIYERALRLVEAQDWQNSIVIQITP